MILPIWINLMIIAVRNPFPSFRSRNYPVKSILVIGNCESLFPCPSPSSYMHTVARRKCPDDGLRCNPETLRGTGDFQFPFSFFVIKNSIFPPTFHGLSPGFFYCHVFFGREPQPTASGAAGRKSSNEASSPARFPVPPETPPLYIVKSSSCRPGETAWRTPGPR